MCASAYKSNSSSIHSITRYSLLKSISLWTCCWTQNRGDTASPLLPPPPTHCACADRPTLFSSLLILYLWLPIFSFFLFLPPVFFFFPIQKNLAQTLINLAQCSVSTKCGLAATLIPQCGALCLTRLPDYVSDLLDNPDCWIELCLCINNHRYARTVML